MAKSKAKRRPKGDPGISKRADGRYYSRISQGMVDGKRKYIHLYGDTRDDVKAQLHDLQHRRAQGYDIRPSKESVAEFLEDFLANKRDISEGTRANYQSHMKRYVREHRFGKMRLADVQPSDVRAFLNFCLDLKNKRGKTISNSTARHIMAPVSAAFAQAASDGIITRNPVSLVKLPAPAKPKLDTFSADEIRQLWEAAKDEPNYVLYVLAPTMACRQGELLALRWSCVDIDGPNPSIRIQASVRRVTGKGILFGKPKTESGNRDIPLDPHQAALLRAHRARQNEARLKVGKLWQDNDLVFCTNSPSPVSYGKPLDSNNLRRRWYKILAQAGIPPRRWHGLRHTAITRMAEAQINPETIRQIAGHADVRITLSVYTHPTEDMKRQAIERLNQAYQAPTEPPKSAPETA